MFEHRTSPLLSRKSVLSARSQEHTDGMRFAVACVGHRMLGYHFLEHLPWLDSFASAAMILSGMGPIGPLETPAGKLFAGCYALFSGLLFITVAGVILAPLAHRLLHKFHLEAAEKKKS